MSKYHVPNKTALAIAGIVILEMAALITGVDGASFGFAIAALAGLGGYELRKATKKE